MHKTSAFPQICIPKQSSMKWTFSQQHSKWSVWVKYPNGTLFQKNLWRGKGYENELFSYSLQTEMAWSVQTEHFSYILYTTTKCTNWTFFQQSSNWSDQDSLKCTKGKTFLQICIPQQSPRKWTFSYSLHIEMSEMAWSVQTEHFPDILYTATKGTK